MGCVVCVLRRVCSVAIGKRILKSAIVAASNIYFGGQRVALVDARGWAKCSVWIRPRRGAGPGAVAWCGDSAGSWDGASGRLTVTIDGVSVWLQ